MNWAERISLLSAGVFFMAGLLCGTWKWLCIRRSPHAKAPYYVDTAHRVSFMSAFACLLLERFAQLSPLEERVEVAAALGLIVFLGVALVSYVVHGLLRDTDNQLAIPHRLGRATIPRSVMTLQMILLVVAEVGGFAVLFAGAASVLLQ